MRKKLEVMAALAAEAGDLSDPEFWEALDSSSMTEGITHLAILLPDNSILTAEGRQPAGQNGLSFEQEAALGTHISDRETDEAGALCHPPLCAGDQKRRNDCHAVLYHRPVFPVGKDESLCL